jgi:hypothetical protein
LFFTKCIASLSRDLFVVASGDSVYRLLRRPAGADAVLNADPEADRHAVATIPRFQGTAIGINVSVQDNAKFSDLLDAIRRAYTFDVKARKKAYYRRIKFER